MTAASADSAETIADGAYPISRPLFIYLNTRRGGDENPAVGAFVDYYVSAEGLAPAGEVGYVALTEEQGQATATPGKGASVLRATTRRVGSVLHRPPGVPPLLGDR